VTTKVAVIEERDTRQRLIEAAGHLFAEHGFKKVTVREIVAVARANVAAVNYHFGDKLGLYREVVEAAIAAQERTTRESREAGEGLPAEERLRRFIRIFVGRAVKHPQSWVRRRSIRSSSAGSVRASNTSAPSSRSCWSAPSPTRACCPAQAACSHSW
jgi:AcrR family transcriptional regulator